MSKSSTSAEPSEPSSKQADDNVRKLSGSQGIQVIARAADILRALKTDPDGLSLGQIASRVNLPRSTVQRIVSALSAERLVVASANEGGLRLGPEIQSLAMAAKRNITQAIRPVLTHLSRTTGETVDLAELQGDQLVFIDQVEGSHRLRTVSAVGEVFPLTDTANGKAVLALMSSENATRFIEQELADVPPSRRQPSDVLREIDVVREQGYSLDCDEHTIGISAVGAAFTDHPGTLYAISIPVPSQRFAEQKELLIRCLLPAIADARKLAGQLR